MPLNLMRTNFKDFDSILTKLLRLKEQNVQLRRFKKKLSKCAHNLDVVRKTIRK